MKPRVVVSRCLLGMCCRYDGRSVENAEVCRAAAENGWIPICPEVMGGLKTPRTPAERRGNSVTTRDGDDVTEQYRRGAEEALKLAKLYGTKYALLKERSPSCGSGVIYDGTFTGAKIGGDGVTAQLFKENGIRVFGESQIGDLIKELDGNDENGAF